MCFCLVLLLAACQGGPFVLAGPTSTPFPESFTGKAQVGANTLVMQCLGSGEPTIILENSVDGLMWDSSALHRFKKISRTCTYNRLGESPGKIEGPRTIMNQVNDLHELLAKTAVPGPYILVGHLSGGYNIVLYASQYPDDVAGLLCVDCYPVGIYQNFMSKLDSQNPNNTQAIVNARNTMNAIYAWQHWYERVDLMASDQELMKVTTLGDRLFILMVATKELHGETILGIGDKNISQLFEDSWNETIRNMGKLSTRGRIELYPEDNMITIALNPKVDETIEEMWSGAKAMK
jgi:pimeloyl-ACP methyl ester carboxylesterase